MEAKKVVTTRSKEDVKILQNHVCLYNLRTDEEVAPVNLQQIQAEVIEQIEKQVDALQMGTRSRRAALEEYNNYKEECTLSNTVSEALNEVKLLPSALP